MFTASRLLVLGGAAVAADAGPRVPHDVGCGLLPRRSRAAATTPPAARPVSDELPAFFPLQPFAARVARDARASRRPGAARRSRRSRASRRSILLHRLCSELRDRRTALPRLRGRRVLPVRLRAQHELLRGPLPAGLARRVRGRALAPSGARVPAGLAAGLTRPAAIPLALGLGADACSRPSGAARRSRAPRAPSRAWRVVFADLERRRDDWLASLHAQQIGWDRSTSIVDAPGELARYISDAVTLGHAQNLLYLTAVPLAAIALVVLWRSGIRDGMFVYAVIAVVAPLATGSAMSLPRFLMGTFPYAVAGGILLDRVDAAPARARCSRSAPPGSWPACGRPIAAAALRRNLAIVARRGRAARGSGARLPRRRPGSAGDVLLPAGARGRERHRRLRRARLRVPTGDAAAARGPARGRRRRFGAGLPPAHDLAVRGAGRRLRAAARLPAAAPRRRSSWRSRSASTASACSCSGGSR